MAFTAIGKIEIDGVELWEFVNRKHAPPTGNAEIRYGSPTWNKGNRTLEIDFAMGTDGDPLDWTVKPEFLK